jgi:hypothetical protein
VILVGSKDDESNNGTSAGYIFLYYISDSGNAGTWKGLTTGSGGRRTYAADQSQIYFGSCVDMDAAGTRFIAGGWGYEKTGKTYGTGSGLAGIFTASGNSWVRETWLYPNNFNYTKNGEFGWDVAMSDDGSRAVVSSLMGETSGEPYAGAVYVFIRNGTTWTQEAALIPDTVKRYSGYGYSVAINGPGDKILVGAVDGDNSGMNTGLVYVFTRQSGKLIKGIEGWHAVPVHSTGWSVFMRTYAVWYGPNAAGKTFTFTATVNIPATGNYVIDYQADDKGIWSIDGGTKTTVTNYTAATPLTQTLNLTAGNHTLEASIYNGTNTTSADYRSNPGGIAITITDSGGTIIWSTLDDVAQSSPWVQSDKLLPADGLGGDNFGSDVTMSVGGDLVVVGAQYASNGGVSASGKVYTFGTPPTGPALTETIILTGTGRAAGDKLGAAVAMSADGQWMVAGSPYADNPSKTDSGTAYVFKLSPTGWTVYKKLTASNAAASDLFGSSVAISQDGAVVVVGAYGAPTGSPVKGAAYVFELNSALNTYDEKTILTANNSGWLGCSVSINAAGDTIAAGARKTAPSDTGSVFVFNKGANWAAGASAVTVISSTSKTGDNFGTSVSLNAAGDKLAIGAIGADKVGSDSGLVYIFSRSANNWTESFNIKPTDSAAVDWFGYSLAFNAAGDKLIVGSPQSNIAGKSNTGAAYIFSIGATGQQLTKLVPSILDPDCNYGWTVGINAAGDKAMVGAIYSDLAGKFAKGGIAYVHSYDTVKDAWSTSPISASNKAAAMNFGSGISCDSTGNTIAVGAQGAKGTPALTDSGAVYIFS